MAWAASIEQLDLEAAKRRQSETDRARTLFVKRLFRVDPADPRLYHLVLDPTVLGIDATVRLLVVASEAFFAANPDAWCPDARAPRGSTPRPSRLLARLGAVAGRRAPARCCGCTG